MLQVVPKGTLLFFNKFSALNRILLIFSSVRKILNSTVSIIKPKNMILWDGTREDFLLIYCKS